jgi:hypothetical protein
MHSRKKCQISVKILRMLIKIHKIEKESKILYKYEDIQITYKKQNNHGKSTNKMINIFAVFL